MKVSFVVPAYNEEALLGACLTSIEEEVERSHQQGLEFESEVVVVNNASTDRTKDVALAFSIARVVDEPTKGLVAARKAGFDATTGDVVANIDADVRLTKGWLTTVLKAFEEDPRLVALSGPFIYDDLSAFVRFWVKVFYGVGYGMHVLLHRVFRTGAMLQGGNFVLRRDAFVQVGGYDTTISFYGEDTDVAKRIQKAGKVRWTFALPVYTSGRRLKAEGVVWMSLKYTINFLWVTCFGKPFSRQHKDIRPH